MINTFAGPSSYRTSHFRSSHGGSLVEQELFCWWKGPLGPRWGAVEGRDMHIFSARRTPGDWLPRDKFDSSIALECGWRKVESRAALTIRRFPMRRQGCANTRPKRNPCEIRGSSGGKALQNGDGLDATLEERPGTSRRSFLRLMLIGLSLSSRSIETKHRYCSSWLH